jgi:hypothetical protein
MDAFGMSVETGNRAPQAQCFVPSRSATTVAHSVSTGARFTSIMGRISPPSYCQYFCPGENGGLNAAGSL